MSQRMTAQKKPHTFHLFDLISIIVFLCIFKILCDTNGIHERVELWLFHLFMKKSDFCAVQTRLALKNKAVTKTPSTVETITFLTYPQVVGYLLRTFATDENVVDIKVEVTTLFKAFNMTLSQCAREFVALPRTVNGNWYVVATTNRYSKRTQAIPTIINH